MDTRLLKKYRKTAKESIKLVPYSDGSIAIECGEYEWHQNHSREGYFWKNQKDIFINTTFKDKAELKKQYDNAIRDLIEDYASKERGRRAAQKTINEIKGE